MARLGLIVWKGKSGKPYNFNICTLEEESPKEGGVYLFSKSVLTRERMEHTPVYIGITHSFQRLFFAPHKHNDIRDAGANRICLMHVADENERKEILHDLLALHDTICN